MTGVFYSFPWEIGRSGIGYTAWSHVNALAESGVRVNLVVGHVEREFCSNVNIVCQTRTLFGRRLPSKLFGGMDPAARYHDIVAAWILSRRTDSQVVHCWPMAAERTLRMAKNLGLPSFLERPNTHTEHAYSVVERVASEAKFIIPKGASHQIRTDRLKREEREYELADAILCPSDYVAKSFRERGFRASKLVRHQYGFDPARMSPPNQVMESFRLAFVGNDGLRKGLHILLEAWQASRASEVSELVILGRLDEAFLTFIRPKLEASGVRYLGFTADVGSYLAGAHCLALPSFEEGSALVTYEARAAGCVLLVSDAAGAVVDHGVDGLVHHAGDHAVLRDHIDLLFSDKNLLGKMRAASLKGVSSLTWDASAQRLAKVYNSALQIQRPHRVKQHMADESPFLKSLKALPNNTLVFVEPLKGNNGDTLILMGLRHCIEKAQLTITEEPESADVILLNGGGAMNDLWPENAATVLRSYLDRWPAKHYIVAPSSFHFSSLRFDQVISKCEGEITIFFRERISFELMAPQLVQQNVQSVLSQDLAFELKDSAFLQSLPVGTEHVLIALRKDVEGEAGVLAKTRAPSWMPVRLRRILSKVRDRLVAFVSKDKVNEIMKAHRAKVPSKKIFRDVSVSVSFEDFGKSIANASLVITNRLHVAILASLLGKDTYLIRGSYHKAEGVYAWSLADNPRVRLI